jgi:hypothetical protein
MAPAALMASLFFLLLLQLHKAKAPHLATATSRSISGFIDPLTLPQSNRLT